MPTNNVESFAPYDIIAGPADVWVAGTDETFPLVEAPVTEGAGNWYYLGYTDGGVQITHNQDTTDLMVDQVTVPVKRMRTTEALTVEFSIASLSIEKYAQVMDQATVTTTAQVAGPPVVPGTESFYLYRGVQISLQKMLIRAPSPLGPGIMQYEIPRVAQTGEPQITFVRDNKAVLACQFTAMADLALPAEQRFGRVVAQRAVTA